MKKKKQAHDIIPLVKSTESGSELLIAPPPKHAIFFQMHIKNLVSIMEILAWDWSATRMPDNYIRMDAVVAKEDAAVIVERLRLSGAEFATRPTKCLGGFPGIELTLNNVLSLWVDTLRFWR